MTIPKFGESPKLRSACQDRCAEFWDPPCWDILDEPRPCGECLRDAGYEPGDEYDAPFDEDAAIGRLL